MFQTFKKIKPIILQMPPFPALARPGKKEEREAPHPQPSRWSMVHQSLKGDLIWRGNLANPRGQVYPLNNGPLVFAPLKRPLSSVGRIYNKRESRPPLQRTGLLPIENNGPLKAHLQWLGEQPTQIQAPPNLKTTGTARKNGKLPLNVKDHYFQWAPGWASGDDVYHPLIIIIII